MKDASDRRRYQRDRRPLRERRVMPLAEAARRRDPQWVAPELLQYEFLAALTKYVRAKRMHAADARSAAFALINPVSFREAADRTTVFDEATRLFRSPYDVEFLVLAETLGVSLVTNDGGMIDDARLPRVRSLRDFAAGR